MRTLYPTVLLFILGLSLCLPVAGRPARGERDGQDGAARAHWQQQHEENLAFRKTLKELSVEEAVAAIKDHRENQYRENLAFFATQKEKRVERINSRERLTDEQKAELISFLEVMHAKKIAFFNEIHQETLELLDELAGNEDLTAPGLHDALKAHRGSIKAKIEAFRDEQRAEWREKIRELVGGRQGNGRGRKQAE